MKTSKEDAADRLVNEILAAIRHYKAAKDAPSRPVQHSFIHEDEGIDAGPWSCDHLERCTNRGMCQTKRALPSKYPVRRQA